jgi:hypothetical protein
MEINIKVNGIHYGKPMNAEIQVKFNKGEYIEVIKAMPTLIAQMKTTLKKGKKS